MYSEAERLTLEVDATHYRDDIHNTLPYALTDHIPDAPHIFGDRTPNRVFSEGKDPESWENTEDWAITYSDGSLHIGQTVRGEGKDCLPGSDITYDIVQLRSFENRLKMSGELHDHLNGMFKVAIPVPEQIDWSDTNIDPRMFEGYEEPEVWAYEEYIQDRLEENGSMEVDVIISRLEKDNREILGGDVMERIGSRDAVF